MSINTWRENAKVEPGSFQWCTAEHKLEQKNFPLNIRKHVFTVKVTKHWHRLSREVMESLFLEIFKSYLGMVLGHLLWLPLLEQGWWTRWPTKIPSKLSHSMILWKLRGVLDKSKCFLKVPSLNISFETAGFSFFVWESFIAFILCGESTRAEGHYWHL